MIAALFSRLSFTVLLLFVCFIVGANDLSVLLLTLEHFLCLLFRYYLFPRFVEVVGLTEWDVVSYYLLSRGSIYDGLFLATVAASTAVRFLE